MFSTNVLNSRIRVSLIFIKILKFNMIASSLQLATQGLSLSQLVAASILQDKNLELTLDFLLSYSISILSGNSMGSAFRIHSTSDHFSPHPLLLPKPLPSFAWIIARSSYRFSANFVCFPQQPE